MADGSYRSATGPITPDTQRNDGRYNEMPHDAALPEPWPSRLDVLDVEARGQGLLELVGLVGVSNAEGVEVLGAADLELGHVARLLDLDGPGILPPGGKEEVLDLVDLLRHIGLKFEAEGESSAVTAMQQDGKPHVLSH